MRRLTKMTVATAVAVMTWAGAAGAKQAAPCKPRGSYEVGAGGARGIAVSPDGKLVVVAGHDGSVRVLDAAKGKVVRTLKGHKAEVYAVAISPNGKVVASGGDDKNVGLWDLHSGKQLAMLPGHQNTVKGLAFSPDGKTLYSASLDKQLGSWDVAGLKANTMLGGQACILQQIATSTGTMKSGAPVAATACNDGLVRLWDLAAGKPKTALEGHEGEVHSVAFASNGDNPLLASGDNDGKVIIWDIKAGKSTQILDGAWTDGLAFSPDGEVLVATGNDMASKGMFKVFSVADGKLLNEQFPHEGNAPGVAFAPDGKTFFTASMDDTVKAWDTAALKKGCN